MQMNGITGKIYRITECFTQYTVNIFLHVSLKQTMKTGQTFHIVHVSTDLLLEYILARVTDEILYFQNRKNL
jgi:hypothetical protein